jgi:hypothetical protein
VATYAKKNREDQFVIMRAGHQGENALVCCGCGTLLVAGPLSVNKRGSPCPRAGCESHYFTEKDKGTDNYVVGMMMRHR